MLSLVSRMLSRQRSGLKFKNIRFTRATLIEFRKGAVEPITINVWSIWYTTIDNYIY